MIFIELPILAKKLAPSLLLLPKPLSLTVGEALSSLGGDVYDVLEVELGERTVLVSLKAFVAVSVVEELGTAEPASSGT